jgi:hypothetical protein
VGVGAGDLRPSSRVVHVHVHVHVHALVLGSRGAVVGPDPRSLIPPYLPGPGSSQTNSHLMPRYSP